RREARAPLRTAAFHRDHQDRRRGCPVLCDSGEARTAAHFTSRIEPGSPTLTSRRSRRRRWPRGGLVTCHRILSDSRACLSPCSRRPALLGTCFLRPSPDRSFGPSRPAVPACLEATIRSPPLGRKPRARERPRVPYLFQTPGLRALRSTGNSA